MRSFAYPSILRGARTVMSEHDVFDRVLAAVHAATLDETPLAGHLGPDRRGLRPDR